MKNEIKIQKVSYKGNNENHVGYEITEPVYVFIPVSEYYDERYDGVVLEEGLHLLEEAEIACQKYFETSLKTKMVENAIADIEMCFLYANNDLIEFNDSDVTE